MYSRKRPKEDLADKHDKVFVPTKAALFALDVRFRPVEQRMLEERLRKTAFKKKAQSKEDGQGNRHGKPTDRRMLSQHAKRETALNDLQKRAVAV